MLKKDIVLVGTIVGLSITTGIIVTRKLRGRNLRKIFDKYGDNQPIRYQKIKGRKPGVIVSGEIEKVDDKIIIIETEGHHIL